jgi:hypothetical protein
MHERKRQEWCDRFGYRQLQSAWGGTWMPGRTTMFMISHGNKGIDLNALEEQLKALPDDFSVDNWKGTSEVHSIRFDIRRRQALKRFGRRGVQS